MNSSSTSGQADGTTASIAYTSVSVRFGSTTAVNGIDLSVATGKTTALIGPSGCGKTTLLRLAIGLQSADSGEVRVLEHSLPSKQINALRHRIGYVVQEGGLFPHLSCAENISIVAKYLNWKSERILARMAELCELVRLPEDMLSRVPAELSGGQRQRVGIMRALFLDPDLLLLDEPLAALDPIVRAELQTDLKQIFERLQKSVLLVTHDLAEAGYLSDDLVLLQSGSIVQSGSLRQLIEQPANEFVTKFVNAQRGISEVLAGANS
ncbi:MAG: osmoprotectant transport system ATP-binding protein [Planctomycetota bacterium]|jgi:osmoprotectant transport system ATP-binding protein